MCCAAVPYHANGALMTNITRPAFRDRGAGSRSNQQKSTDEAPRDGPRGGYGARVRGGMFNLPFQRPLETCLLETNMCQAVVVATLGSVMTVTPTSPATLSGTFKTILSYPEMNRANPS